MNVLYHTLEGPPSYVNYKPLTFTWYGRDARAYMSPRIPEWRVDVKEVGSGWCQYTAQLNPSEFERNCLYNPDFQRRLVRMPEYLVDFSRVQVRA